MPININNKYKKNEFLPSITTADLNRAKALIRDARYILEVQGDPEKLAIFDDNIARLADYASMQFNSQNHMDKLKKEAEKAKLKLIDIFEEIGLFEITLEDMEISQGRIEKKVDENREEIAMIKKKQKEYVERFDKIEQQREKYQEEQNKKIDFIQQIVADNTTRITNHDKDIREIRSNIELIRANFEEFKKEAFKKGQEATSELVRRLSKKTNVPEYTPEEFDTVESLIKDENGVIHPTLKKLLLNASKEPVMGLLTSSIETLLLMKNCKSRFNELASEEEGRGQLKAFFNSFGAGISSQFINLSPESETVKLIVDGLKIASSVAIVGYKIAKIYGEYKDVKKSREIQIMRNDEVLKDLLKENTNEYLEKVLLHYMIDQYIYYGRNDVNIEKSRIRIERKVRERIESDDNLYDDYGDPHCIFELFGSTNSNYRTYIEYDYEVVGSETAPEWKKTFSRVPNYEELIPSETDISRAIHIYESNFKFDRRFDIKDYLKDSNDENARSALTLIKYWCAVKELGEFRKNLAGSISPFDDEKEFSKFLTKNTNFRRFLNIIAGFNRLYKPIEKKYQYGKNKDKLREYLTNLLLPASNIHRKDISEQIYKLTGLKYYYERIGSKFAEYCYNLFVKSILEGKIYGQNQEEIAKNTKIFIEALHLYESMNNKGCADPEVFFSYQYGLTGKCQPVTEICLETLEEISKEVPKILKENPTPLKSTSKKIDLIDAFGVVTHRNENTVEITRSS